MLQSTIDAPLGQWALGEQRAIALTRADRSGNGRDLTWSLVGSAPGPYSPSSGNVMPDLRPDYCAWYNLQSPVNNPPSLNHAAVRLTGAMTLTLRACMLGMTGRTEHLWVACSGSRNGTEAENCLYAFGAQYNGSAFVLRYMAEQGAGVDIGYVSTLSLIVGKWYFVALRRSAAGVVTVTRGDASSNAHQTSGALAVPTGGGNAQLRFGVDNLNSPFAGGIADVCLWDHELTEVQLDTLRKEALSELIAA